MSGFHDNVLLGASGSQGYQISRSVRLRSSASAYFNRTQSTPTDEKKFTHSAWLKRGRLGVYQAAIGGRDNSTAQTPLAFNASDQIVWAESDGVSTFYSGTTAAVFRDPSAWYHIVCVYDSNNATAADRLIIYINGVRQTITVSGSGSSIPLSRAGYWNQSGTSVLIGATNTGTDFFDGYLTEINFIDGQALTPSSFGETNPVTGVWQPKKYAGTYGTNGFYLNFSDNSAATAAAIGKDYSGNGNNWTPNNISVTAGVTYDSMIDVPTQWADGGNGRGNYCTFSPIDTGGGSVTLSGGNLNYAIASSTGSQVRGTMGTDLSSKWYWEFTCGSNAASLTPVTFGISTLDGQITNNTTSLRLAANIYTDGVSNYTANLYVNGSGTSVTTQFRSAAIGDIIQVAYDAATGKLWFGKNNTWYDAVNTTTGNPSAGTNPVFTIPTGSAMTPFLSNLGASYSGSLNCGQRPFAYTPPTGFKALNTLNLPTPTILKGNQFFDATLYTANASSQTISSLQFQPDFLWIKSRSGAYSNILQDSVRGATNQLFSNLTNAEFTGTDRVQSFTSNGWTMGADAAYGVNAPNGATQVAWSWKANGTPAVTNTAGSITSTVSVGATQGFSVVTYTGNATNNATIGHGLGVAPAMVIVKNRAASTFWYVFHSSLPATNNLYLNGTDAQQPDNVLRSTNSTTFTVSSSSAANGSSQAMVAYCFAAVAGYSAFGSYTGNGSADGTFVYLGFRPRFVLFKRTDSTASWYIYDTSRNTFNTMNNWLSPNQSVAENTSTTWEIDIVSNGFKIRNSGAFSNANGGTYIYAAFCETSFKFSLGR